MGKATIIASLGKGEYRIKVEFDNARVQARLAAIVQNIADLTTSLGDLEGKESDALTGLQGALSVMDNYIAITPPEQYAQDPTYLNELTKYVYDWRAYYDNARHQVRLAKLKITGLKKDKFYLEKFCPADFETNAWCVAYKEDLAGTTETIECDYLLKRDPGNNGIKNDTGVWIPAAVTTPITQMQHPLATSVHANWFNLCMAPAMQRYKGRYRIGIITSIDTAADKCNLTLYGESDAGKGSNLVTDQPIFPNVGGAQKQTLTGVDIVYGACNAAAFRVDDKVIIDLHSGAGSPTVIGFHDNPRKCPAPYSITWVPYEYTGSKTTITDINNTYTAFDGCGLGRYYFAVVSKSTTKSRVWSTSSHKEYSPIAEQPGDKIIIEWLLTGSSSSSDESVPYSWSGHTWLKYTGISDVNTSRQITVSAFDGVITLPAEYSSRHTESYSLDNGVDDRDEFEITKIVITNDEWYYEADTWVNDAYFKTERVRTNRKTGVVTTETLSYITLDPDDVPPLGLSDDYLTPCLDHDPSQVSHTEVTEAMSYP